MPSRAIAKVLEKRRFFVRPIAGGRSMQ